MPDETPPPTDPDAPTNDAPVDTDPVDSGPDSPGAAAGSDQVPDDVVDEAERLTRLAREAVDDAEAAAYREDRAGLLDEHDYTARVREDDTREVLVLHPAEWVEDGTVYPDRIDDVDRGVEVPLSGPGEGADWEAVDAHNRDLVASVRADHGAVHGDNAAALADFAGNHYAKPIEEATRAELAEFLTEYFPRNAWPSDEQRAVVAESVRLVFEAADEPCPLPDETG